MNAVGVGNRRILHEHADRHMCLVLTVRLADADSARTAEIAQAAGVPGAPKGWWSRLARPPSGALASFSCLAGSFDRAQQS